MAVAKNNKSVSGNKEKNSKSSTNRQKYVKQKFSPEALALIHKYKLHSSTHFSKLIKTFQDITELGKKNSKYKDLTKMWEDEFNFLFENFWLEYTASKQMKKSKIDGWQSRLKLNSADNGSSIEDKKLKFLQKVQPNFAYENSLSKKEILEKAGYKGVGEQKTISFTATSKSRNLNEIENILTEAKTLEFENKNQSVDIFRSIKKTQVEEVEKEKFDKEEVKPDPGLLDFLNEPTKNLRKYKSEDEIEYSSSNKLIEDDPVSNETDQELRRQKDTDVEDIQIGSIRELIDDESKDYSVDNSYSDKFDSSTSVSKDASNIAYDDEIIDGEIPEDFYEDEFKKIYDQESGIEIESTIRNVKTYDFKDNYSEKIDPTKRNILSKDDFQYDDTQQKSAAPIYKKEEKRTQPYHEIKPVGVYEMAYDPGKRPSTIKSMYFDEKEEEINNELDRKLKLLRDLKTQRRHRINMLRIEKSNSSIIAKAIEFRNKREIRFARKKNIENMRTMERIEKLRRLQERQRLVNLLKQRQLKLEDEKRVAAQIKLERQKRLEREAQYKMDLASIEAQIHREMELIKNIELKAKAEFLKNNDLEKNFEESLALSKETRFADIELALKNEQNEKELSNKDKIEQIALKFKKNL